MELDLQTIIVILVALTLGGLSKSITGIGLPMIAIPIMSSFIGMQNAVLVMVLPGIVSNLWMMIAYRDQMKLLKSQWVYLAAGIVGGAIGAWVLVHVSERVLLFALAGWTFVALAFSIFKPTALLKPGVGKVLAPVAGLVGGVSQGALGISAPAVATYAYSLQLEPRGYVYAVSVAFLLFGGAQALAFIQLGLYTHERLVGGMIALVPLFVTIPVGIWLSKFISRKAFNVIIIVMLVMMNAKLIYDAIHAT